MVTMMVAVSSTKGHHNGKSKHFPKVYLWMCVVTGQLRSFITLHKLSEAVLPLEH